MNRQPSKLCNEFIPSKWDNLCNKCRNSEAHHRNEAKLHVTSVDELARIAAVRCERLENALKAKREHEHELVRIKDFFRSPKYCEQRTIAFPAQRKDGTADERLRTKVPFHDGKFPKEMLEGLFRQLGTR
jgi:hypothetical protein